MVRVRKKQSFIERKPILRIDSMREMYEPIHRIGFVED